MTRSGSASSRLRFVLHPRVSHSTPRRPKRRKNQECAEKEDVPLRTRQTSDQMQSPANARGQRSHHQVCANPVRPNSTAPENVAGLDATILSPIPATPLARASTVYVATLRWLRPDDSCAHDAGGRGFLARNQLGRQIRRDPRTRGSWIRRFAPGVPNTREEADQ